MMLTSLEFVIAAGTPTDSAMTMINTNMNIRNTNMFVAVNKDDPEGVLEDRDVNLELSSCGDIESVPLFALNSARYFSVILESFRNKK